MRGRHLVDGDFAQPMDAKVREVAHQPPLEDLDFGSLELAEDNLIGMRDGQLNSFGHFEDRPEGEVGEKLDPLDDLLVAIS